MAGEEPGLNERRVHEQPHWELLPGGSPSWSACASGRSFADPFSTSTRTLFHGETDWIRRRQKLGFKLPRFEWAGKKKSLSFVDVIGAQNVQLTGCLDALGEGREARILAELDTGNCCR